MKNYIKIGLMMALIAFMSNCSAQDSRNEEYYIFKKGDKNGIGKWYLGRQIAYVMDSQGINWLERSDRGKEENTSRLLKNMDIQSSEVIADIGAGSGYHVFKMSPMLTDGLVYAVDIQEEMIEALENKISRGSVENVQVITGSEKSVNLPENSVDKVLMVDVYHEFNFPVEMIASIKKALKADGKIYLIEYRGEDQSVPIKRLHKMTERQAVKEMKAAGLKLKQNIDNLPWQHCMVFVKQ